MDKVATTSGFGEAVQYLSGFLFVLLVLCMLWLVVEAIGIRFKRQDKKKAEAHAAVKKRLQTPASPEPVAEKPGQIPEEHLVAITAAVTMMLGKQHRLVSIRKSSADWGREGRREHLHSHSFR